MIAGNGVVKADPKKVRAIAAWPRPSRLEDVEKFLATTVFIREDLSPRYSQVSKPLRDVLTILQGERKAGRRKCKARYLPNSSAPEDGSWPWFWNPDCEAAFKTLKQLVVDAVELQIPHFAGAAEGSNPFHIWPDACSYGVGAGLFQGYPQETSPVPCLLYTSPSPRDS